MWTALLLACAGCYVLKLAGLSLPERVLSHPTVERVADLIPVALLAALVAVQVFSGGTSLALDARVLGLGFAVVAAALTVTPGLDTALVLRAALTRSRAEALATGAGIVAGLLLAFAVRKTVGALLVGVTPTEYRTTFCHAAA